MGSDDFMLNNAGFLDSCGDALCLAKAFAALHAPSTALFVILEFALSAARRARLTAVAWRWKSASTLFVLLTRALL